MHPTIIRSTQPSMPTVAHTDTSTLVFGSGAHRLLLLALFATLALALSGPAAADKRHDHGYGHHNHHGHSAYKQHPRHTKGPQHHSRYSDKHYHAHHDKHHNKHHNKHYVNHHHSAPQRHAPAQGFSLNIWGIAPLLSSHHHNVSASFHYHGDQRCYHRH